MEAGNIIISPAWRKSKEDIWNEVFSGLQEKPIRIDVQQKMIWRYLAAAVVFAAIALATTAYFYTENIVIPRGEHASVTLPDGSRIEINADSRLSYKPLWWRVSRDVKLTGEAFFEVAQGSTFRVISPQATVSVLGTEFNVFSRDDKYTITCLSGKVKVSNELQVSLLDPGMQASIEENTLTTYAVADAAQSVGWVTNNFFFIGVPLNEVIAEIERQYNIEIDRNTELNDLYTGNFSKSKDIQTVLEIVGKPFGITLKMK